MGRFPAMDRKELAGRTQEPVPLDQRIAFVTCEGLPDIHGDDRLVATNGSGPVRTSSTNLNNPLSGLCIEQRDARVDRPKNRFAGHIQLLRKES